MPDMTSESTPLLGSRPTYTAKLAYGQLAILCYARWIDSWFFFTIFPVRLIHVGGIAGMSELISISILSSTYPA